MVSSCVNITFGIRNQNEKVRAGLVKAFVCEAERDLNDWLGENSMHRPSIFLGLPIGILKEILLISSQRGKGLATPALKNCIDLCVERFCTGIILNAVPQEKCPIDLVAWYERHGFKVIGPSGLGQFMLLTLPGRAAATISTN